VGLKILNWSQPNGISSVFIFANVLNLNVILSKEIVFPKFSNDLQELQIYILGIFCL